MNRDTRNAQQVVRLVTAQRRDENNGVDAGREFIGEMKGRWLMKWLSAMASVVILLLFSSPARAQGSIFIQNVGPGLNAPVHGIDGMGVPAGSPLIVELGFGAWPDALSPLSGERRSFVGNGWFGLGAPEAIIPGFPPGSQPWLQVRVYESRYTNYDQALKAGGVCIASRVFQLLVGLGNPTATPPFPGPMLFGMLETWWSWNYEPPTRLSIIRVSPEGEMVASSTTTAESTSLRILTSTSLSETAWTTFALITNAPPQYEFTVPVSRDEPARFFRVLRAP